MEPLWLPREPPPVACLMVAIVYEQPAQDSISFPLIGDAEVLSRKVAVLEGLA